MDPTVPSCNGAHGVKNFKTSDVFTSEVPVMQRLFYVSLVHLAPHDVTFECPNKKCGSIHIGIKRGVIRVTPSGNLFGNFITLILVEVRSSEHYLCGYYINSSQSLITNITICCQTETLFTKMSLLRMTFHKYKKDSISQSPS